MVVYGYYGLRGHVVYSTSAAAYIMVIMTKKAPVRKQKKGFYQTIQTGSSKEENCVGDLSILRRISCENRPEAAPPMQHNNTTLMAKF